MYNRCITERSAKQQQCIEASMLELLDITSYHELTVSSLCQHAGISRYAFYRLYDCKDDVLDSLVDQTLLAFLHIQPSRRVGHEDLSHSTRDFFNYWSQQKPLLRALCSNGKSSLLVERSVNFLAREDEVIKQYFVANESEYGDEIFRFCVSGVFSLVTNWHQSGYQKSVEQMSEILEMLLKKPLFHPNLI